MSIGKMYCNGSRNHWVANFCFKFLYGCFILLLHFSIFIIMNIQWSKQPHYTWSCLRNLHFVVCFCYFWRDKQPFASFNPIYFWIARSNSSMKGDGGSIFGKTSDWKSLFLLQIKMKQSSGCPSKEFNAIFKYIN